MSEFFNDVDGKRYYDRLDTELSGIVMKVTYHDSRPQNLEEVMTHIDAGLGFPGLSIATRERRRRALMQLHDFIAERLAISDSAPPCPLHARLLQHALEEKATVLTLNYDLIIDHVASKSDTPLAYCTQYMASLLQDERTSWEDVLPMKVLKLHGSLNWWRCPTTECPRHQELYIFPYGLKDMTGNREIFAERCRRCGALHERAIVPPTMKAVFSSHPRLGYLWALAFDALAAAERVIIVGVSFAPSDYLLRWLLRDTNTPAKEVIVVDIEHAVARTISAMLGSQVEWYRSLSEYLDGDEAELVRPR